MWFDLFDIWHDIFIEIIKKKKKRIIFWIIKFQLTPFVKRSEERKHLRWMFVVCESSISDLERKCIHAHTIYHLCCLLMIIYVCLLWPRGVSKARDLQSQLGWCLNPYIRLGQWHKNNIIQWRKLALAEVKCNVDAVIFQNHKKWKHVV